MNRRGMTVVELCLLLAILVLVAAISFPALFRNRQRRQAAQCAAQLEVLSMSCKEYAASNGAWPKTQDSLVPTYLKETLACPGGGTYSLGSPEGDVPVCSLPGHHL